MYAYEYSEKEVQLVKAVLGGDNLLKNPEQPPPLVYMTLSYCCFMDGRDTPVARSVRRCCKALEKGGFRPTPEFDSLIDLGGE